MKFRYNNFRLPVGKKVELTRAVAKELGIPPDLLQRVEIKKKALDARRKNALSFVYTLDLHVDDYFPDSLKERLLAKGLQAVRKNKNEPLQSGTEKLPLRPVVIGTGPAGLFCALLLSSRGYRPLVLERGKNVEERTRDVEHFWTTGQFSPESNVQFGEGGAGTFSDGKLTTRINDARVEKVLQEFVEAGAPPEILYLHKPHIGTDKLKVVVKSLREKIISLGGEVRFACKVTDFLIEEGKIKGLIVNGGETIRCVVVVAAIGHSARDTYQSLYDRGVHFEPKPFSIGVRIEHLQKAIDLAQYGKYAGHADLGAAEYQLVYRDRSTGRTAYTFCMCPGGTVVAAASEAGGVVTNGMSEFCRDGRNANSALAVTIDVEDFGSDHPLAGIEFQRRWEQAAFRLGGGTYFAPAQKVGDFLEGKVGDPKRGRVKPTYRPGVVGADLAQCLPPYVTEVLKRAIPALDKKLQGFAHPDGVMTAVETRTSAPVRITRGQNGMSVNTYGLYPAGEGAGYAGGIVSAAVDGMRIAEKIISTFALPPGD